MAKRFVQEVCLASYEHIFSPNVLKNKVAFITGGGSGIGFRIAEILMRHGCRTAIASRNLERVKEAAGTLEKATSQECLPIQLDVRKPEDVEKAVEDTVKKFSGIDFLINNAAGNFLSPAASLSPKGYQTVMEIDAGGTFNASKAVYDGCLRDKGGVIVNITATLHYRGTAFQMHAGSAKAAIDAQTKHLAVEWGPQGVRVVGVAPGPITDTEGMRKLGGKNPDLEWFAQDIPLGRMGTREEIAHTVLFLVSPAASLITGETIVADGGAWMGHPNSISEVVKRMQSYQS